MSTRRPRIKAVASLPVRRRNADAKGSATQKQVENDAPAERNERIQSPTKPPDLKGSPATCEASQNKSSIAPNDSDVETKNSAAPATRTGSQAASLTHTETAVVGEPLGSLNLTRSIIVSPIKSPKYTETSLKSGSSPRTHSSSRTKVPNSNTEVNLSHGIEYNIPNLELSSAAPSSKPKNAEGTTKTLQNIPSTISSSVNVVTKLSPLIIVGQTSSEDNANPTPGEMPPASPEAMVDGIVPLSTRRSRTVDLLKNEIISESAEVLFDPIVPLPSPGKLRPKLRPTPRLASVRRNSVQGSASESEDEHKRAMAGAGAMGGAGGPAGTGRTRHDSQSSLSTHHSQQPLVRDSGRTRNDSVCSVLSHAAPTLPSSPLKDKHLASRLKRGGGGGGGGAGGDSSRQAAAQRRRQRVRGAAVQRDQLTMYDLIFYNPTTNPILETEEAKQARLQSEVVGDAKPESEAEDDPPPAPPEKAEPGKTEAGKTEAGKTEAGKTEAGEEVEADAGEAEAAPVPQIKLGPDGQIVIDEQSLVIERTEEQRQLSSSVVREWGGGGGGGRYSRVARTKKWEDEETVRFYRALAAIGTDFSLMLPLFPDRSRRDLKMKFKKEERNNGAQIDKALTARGSFRVEALAEQFARERREAREQRERHAREIREQEQLEVEQLKQARRIGVKLGRASKTMVGIIPTRTLSSLVLTADDIIAENVVRAPKRKLPLRPPPPPPPAPPPLPPAPLASPALKKYMTTAQEYELPPNVNPLAVAKNVAPGSLVCLTIPDPRDPTKKVLQTYVSDGRDKLTPVDLPAGMLGSIMDYMKSEGPAGPTPLAPRPSGSPAPGPSRPAPPGPSPQPGRIRHNSYTIMNL